MKQLKLANKIFIWMYIFLFVHITIAQESDETSKKSSNLLQLVSASSTKFAELNPVISPDGKKLFFTRVENEYGKSIPTSQNIWVMDRVDETNWSAPRELPPEINISDYNALLSFAGPDHVIIMGHYNDAGLTYRKRGISLISYTNNVWGVPEPIKVRGLGNMVNGHYLSAFMSMDRSVLLLSFSKSYNKKEQDVFYSLRIGKHYTRPRKIHIISKGNYDQRSPILSNDKKKIYFCAFDPVTQNYQVMVSTRKDSLDWKSWIPPVPLGDSINSEFNEMSFRLSHDESQAFIVNDKQHDFDIFIATLKPNNVTVRVSGHLIHPVTQQIVTEPGVSFYNGDQLLDSVIYDSLLGTFSLFLTSGMNYQLQARTDITQGEAVMLSLEKKPESKKIELDLPLMPKDFVTINAKVIDPITLATHTIDNNMTVVVNDKALDKYTISDDSKSFQFNLPYGKYYTASVSKPEHSGIEKTLDFTGIFSFATREETFHLEKIVGATISGRILDEKTKRLIPKNESMKIWVDGKVYGSAQVDENMNYKLILPNGFRYEIEAQAKGYFARSGFVDLRNKAGNNQVSHDLYVSKAGVGEAVKLNNIRFETGKATLLPISFFELNRVVIFLKNNEEIRIEIAGHTDSQGSNPLNQRLSERRANSVRSYLIGKSINPLRIVSRGYGEDVPIADNNTREGRAINRRVEFKVIK